MTDFITNLYIESFRGINCLSLQELTGINILTGDNNSGKTSVLEVIRCFEQPSSFRKWRSILRKDAMIPSSFGMSYYEGFLNLFNVEDDLKKIEYEAEFPNGRIRIKMTGHESEEEMTVDEYEKNIQMVQRYRREGEETDDHLITVPKLELELEVNGKEAGRGEIYEGGNISGSRKMVSEDSVKKIIYISPVRHAEGSLYLAEVLDDPELYEEMLEVLKEYDKDIMSINYVKNYKGMGGEYKILSRTRKKALSLNVYGDGMKKAVLLMSAAIKAKGGILLLDEFETAIHTSAMEKTFRWILETCHKLDVQLFLTSHSKEAIAKVLKCAPCLQDNMAVYTLYKDDDRTTVRRLSGRKAIEAQDNMGLELR